ncbi:hypothetical protein FNYG_13665 [Fusarium nygamai]|uniref:Uncharacterized protein n=1 Tax=Gibberella nygamai TaxID=42673 RepID=A0A2K0UV05_GIBNY|nr:hypothetical protein FNYG_13665 [Fusarium nygamai]
MKDTMEGCITFDTGLAVKSPRRRCHTEYTNCSDSNVSS